MHPLIGSYLTKFSEEHAIESMDEADRFERFVNYCVVTNRCPTRVDADDITTGDGEVGIDGVAVLVGDELVATVSDARDLFAKRNRDIHVRYLFIQSKRSEGFARDAFLNLGAAVRSLLAGDGKLHRDPRLEEVRLIHAEVVKNVNKLRNGQPSCSLFIATTGTWTAEEVLEVTRQQVIEDVARTKYFDSVEMIPLGFDELKKEWMATRSPTEAKFAVLGELPLPAMEGVSEAIVVLVSAPEFVKNVLCDENGSLRSTVFERNVRHFLGEDNDVNGQIRRTLRDARQKHRFAILNNGITIVAKEIRRVSTTVLVKDFQIVNGCQTSHVLFHSRAELDPQVILVVKAVSSAEGGVVDEVVVATNSQTQVAESQFYAIRDEVRSIQSFFASFPGADGDDRRLFFERRLGEFSEHDIAATRIFDIHLLAKVYASMFLDAPHDALGSPRRVYELKDLFSGADIAYYTAAFVYYRMVLMLGNNQIQRADGYLKWHVLTAIRYLALGALPVATAPDLAVRKGCEALLEDVWKAPKESLALYQEALRVVKAVSKNSEQELRTSQFTDRLIAAAKRAQARRPAKTTPKRGGR